MKKFLRIVVPVILALVLISSVIWYLFVFDRAFTRDMLLKQARLNDLRGNTRTSAWFYNLAYSYSGKDEDVAIELANQYKESGNYTKAEVTLSRAINSGATVDLYTALCKTYVEQDKLMDAVALLAGIGDPYIKAELDSLRPTAPEPDHKPGFYSQYIKVSLKTSEGTILYTTTGEYPSITNEPYSSPITMGAGETVIYAISVNNDGLVSPVTVMGFTVGGVIEPAIFMDVAMEAAVREQLGISSDKLVYTNDLWKIAEFVVPENVGTLEDISMMTYLEKLTVESKQINSLSFLDSLGRLQSLSMNGCRFPVADLRFVAGLPELTDLNLSDCGISTISDLAGAPKLQYLDISENTVRNLDVLTDMKDLRELRMQHNALTDLTALSPLSKLKVLDVSYNSLESIQPLTSCMQLEELNASNNLLTSTNGIATLPMLTSLALNFNSISEISELSACLQMKELSISNNSIIDLSGLAGLTNLEIFDFSYNSVYYLPAWPEGCALRVIEGSYNSVASVDILAKMDNLTYVSMDYNQLNTVDALANCNNLVQVNVYGNKIESVSKLTEHNIIVNYDPTGTSADMAAEAAQEAENQEG